MKKLKYYKTYYTDYIHNYWLQQNKHNTINFLRKWASKTKTSI